MAHLFRAVVPNSSNPSGLPHRSRHLVMEQTATGVIAVAVGHPKFRSFLPYPNWGIRIKRRIKIVHLKQFFM